MTILAQVHQVKHGHAQLRQGGLSSKKEIHTYKFVETVGKGSSRAVEKSMRRMTRNKDRAAKAFTLTHYERFDYVCFSKRKKEHTNATRANLAQL